MEQLFRAGCISAWGSRLGLPAEARQLRSNATQSLGCVGTVPWLCTYALSCRKRLSRTEVLIMLKLRLQGHRCCMVD